MLWLMATALDFHRSQQLKKMYFILTIIRYPEVLTTVAAYIQLIVSKREGSTSTCRNEPVC